MAKKNRAAIKTPKMPRPPAGYNNEQPVYQITDQELKERLVKRELASYKAAFELIGNHLHQFDDMIKQKDVPPFFADGVKAVNYLTNLMERVSRYADEAVEKELGLMPFLGLDE